MTQLRAQIVIKTNWLRGKVDFIREVLFNAIETDSVEEVISNFEFKNEEEASKLKPTKSNPKEVSFIKNNPKEKMLSNPSTASTENP